MYYMLEIIQKSRTDNIIKGLIKKGVPTQECKFPLSRFDQLIKILKIS